MHRHPGEILLSLHHPLHQPHLIRGEFVDHRARYRDEWCRRSDGQHRNPELVAGRADRRRNLGETHAGVEGQCRTPGVNDALHVVTLAGVRVGKVEAGGHHEFTPGQPRTGIREFDRMGPGDRAIEAGASRGQRQSELADRDQTPDRHRHDDRPRCARCLSTVIPLTTFVDAGNQLSIGDNGVLKVAQGSN